MVWPVPALVGEALKPTVCPIVGFVGENTNAAAGGVPPVPTATERLAVDDSPRSLTTVRLTLKEPSLVKTCVAAGPLAVPPSPKSQLYDVIVRSVVTHPPWKPASGQLPDPSNATVDPTDGVVGLKVNCAVGGAADNGLLNVDGP